MNTGINSHFHPDERPFVDKASDWIERSARQHAPKLTDFLDPRQQFIVESLITREDTLQVRADGGYKDAERKRMLIAPDYMDLAEEDMGIVVLDIASDDNRLGTLEHGDYMGAILSLGIKREKLGDLQVSEQGCQGLVAVEIADFMRLQLSQVHRVHVRTEIKPLSGLAIQDVSLEEMTLSVASLRLDGIASDAYRLSRSKIMAPIKAGRCRVNFKVVEDPGKQLREGDLVSLQGCGRFKVLEVEGVTKSGRTRVRIGKYR